MSDKTGRQPDGADKSRSSARPSSRDAECTLKQQRESQADEPDALLDQTINCPGKA